MNLKKIFVASCILGSLVLAGCKQPTAADETPQPQAQPENPKPEATYTLANLAGTLTSADQTYELLADGTGTATGIVSGNLTWVVAKVEITENDLVMRAARTVAQVDGIKITPKAEGSEVVEFQIVDQKGFFGFRNTKTKTIFKSSAESPNLTISESSIELVKNGKTTLTATQKVEWISSDNTIVHVDEDGVVTAIAIGGPITVTATSKSNTAKTAKCTVTVVAGPTYTLENLAGTLTAEGQTITLKADGTGTATSGRSPEDITWEVTAGGIKITPKNTELEAMEFQIIDSEGVFGFKHTSSGTIFKSDTDSPNLSISKTSLEILHKKTTTLTATQKVTWTSSDESIVTISQEGFITAINAGSASVTAISKANPNVFAVCRITVTPIQNVTLFEIPGIAKPARGQTVPNSTIDTEQYTGTISWTPDGATFAAGTVYTATIELIAKEGWTLDNVAANAFVVPGATSSANPMGAGRVTAVFPQTGAEGEYELGDIGPAGGIIIYDKGSETSDWRYIEAARADWNGDAIDPKGVPKTGLTPMPNTKNGIGSGRNNSYMIREYSAAGTCRAYEGGERIGAWFLPSIDELKEMYKFKDVLELTGDGTNPNDDQYYASSSGVFEDGASGQRVWSFDMASGKADNQYSKDSRFHLRPIRYVSIYGDPVNKFDIDIAAPVRGETPASAITETSQYTATVSWNPAPETVFLPNIEYTATITFTIKSSWKLDLDAERNFKVGGTYVTKVKDGVVSFKFPKTLYPPVTDLQLSMILPEAGKDITNTLTGSAQLKSPSYIEWKENGGYLTKSTFKPQTVYSGTLSLYPGEGYTFVNADLSQYKIEGLSVINATKDQYQDMVRITFEFPATGNLPMKTTWLPNFGAPVIDSTAAVTAENDEATATIAWSPELVDGKFARNTVYSATMTLTPKNGWTVPENPETFFTAKSDETITYADGKWTIVKNYARTNLYAPGDLGPEYGAIGYYGKTTDEATGKEVWIVIEVASGNWNRWADNKLYAWTTETGAVLGASGEGIGDGFDNTYALTKNYRDGPTKAKWPAAANCNEHNMVDYQPHGWFLPSIGELKAIYDAGMLNDTYTLNTYDATYWSSTIAEDAGALPQCFNFSTGKISTSPRNTLLNARPVRVFTIPIEE